MPDQPIQLISSDAESVFTSTELAPAVTVSLQSLKGGKQEGTQLIIVDNGAITLRIIPTRGMGILDVTENSGDIRLGWDSPVKEVVHPQNIDLTARGGLGWLEGFNEWMVRCGLEWYGPPCSDPHHHAPAEATAGPLTLHGRIANTPASEVCFHVDENTNTLHLIGKTYETMLYGPKFELETEIVVNPNSLEFKVIDRITNLGGQAQEFGLLYHLNHGMPLMEANAKWLAPIDWLYPSTDDAKAHLDHYDTYLPPTTGIAEHVYFTSLKTNAAGDTMALLQNANENMGVRIGFNTNQLPYFIVWKAQHNLDDGYVTGLEPSTGFPRTRPEEREAGRVPVIAAKETRTFELNFELLPQSDAVKRVQSEISELLNGHAAQILEVLPQATPTEA